MGPVGTSTAVMSSTPALVGSVGWDASAEPLAGWPAPGSPKLPMEGLAGAAASGPEWRGSVNPGSSAAGAWRPASASSQDEAPPGDAAPSSGPDVGPGVSPGVPCPPELDQAGPDPAPMPLSRPSLAPGRDSPGRSVLPVPVVGLASGRVSPPDPAATRARMPARRPEPAARTFLESPGPAPTTASTAAWERDPDRLGPVPADRAHRARHPVRRPVRTTEPHLPAAPHLGTTRWPASRHRRPMSPGSPSHAIPAPMRLRRPTLPWGASASRVLAS